MSSYQVQACDWPIVRLDEIGAQVLVRCRSRQDLATSAACSRPITPAATPSRAACLRHAFAQPQAEPSRPLLM